MIKASFNSLKADGWAVPTKTIRSAETWPATGRIILEKGDDILVHTFALYKDSSDYPGDDRDVRWEQGTLTPVTLYEVTLARSGPGGA